jgi:hypothetical protein
MTGLDAVAVIVFILCFLYSLARYDAKEFSIIVAYLFHVAIAYGFFRGLSILTVYKEVPKPGNPKEIYLECVGDYDLATVASLTQAIKYVNDLKEILSIAEKYKEK